MYKGRNLVFIYPVNRIHYFWRERRQIGRTTVIRYLFRRFAAWNGARHRIEHGDPLQSKLRHAHPGRHDRAEVLDGLERDFVAVAVGTTIADRPPHRSVRAVLPHTALTSDAWRRSARWGTDAGCVARESTAGRVPPGVPSFAGFSVRGGAIAAARAGSPAAGTFLRCAYCSVPRDSGSSLARPTGATGP